MNRNYLFLPLFSLALAGCLGGDDPGGDGQADIQHATGHWQLDWVCDQGGERITGCSIGDIYDVHGLSPDGHVQLGVTWEGDRGTGVLRSNALSVTFEHGPLGTPEYYTEDAVYTFDRADTNFFKKSSTYGGNGVNGICAGTAIRIPAEQFECKPRT